MAGAILAVGAALDHLLATDFPGRDELVVKGDPGRLGPRCGMRDRRYAG